MTGRLDTFRIYHEFELRAWPLSTTTGVTTRA